MSGAKRQRRGRLFGRLQTYLAAGILTVIPIWITWVVFNFLLRQLSGIGMPWVRALSRALHPYSPALARWLTEPSFQATLGVLLTVIGLYVLGWAATLVVGKRLIALFDALIRRIPLVQTIYGLTKTLLAALQNKPEEVERVVFIEFPSPGMKTIGFVTRLLTDETTGRKLAAIYVPTTPNPTSGYLEIVPVENIVSTDWTLDEAMSFVISGGAVSPDTLRYTMEEPPESSAQPVKEKP